MNSKAKDYKVEIRVYLNELVEFYKGDSDYGTPNQPYPADLFYELISPSALFFGPQKNILLFEKNCNYHFMIVSSNGQPIQFDGNDDGKFLAKMISKDGSIGKWQKVFPKVKASDLHNKELKLPSTTPGKDVFTLTTAAMPEKDIMFKYSFSFSFIDDNGVKKYATIDPGGGSGTPPPKWP